MKIPQKRSKILGQVQHSIINIFNYNNLIDFLWLNLGTFFIALGIYLFKFPNNFNTGGISGLALFLTKIFPDISPAAFMFVINTLLLVLGYIFFGKKFGLKTVYSSLILSFMIEVMEKIHLITNPLTNLPTVELLFSVILPGVGAAIIFNIDASNGGTDILGMIVKKYTNLNIGTTLGIVDTLMVVISFPVFPLSINLLNILGLLIKATITDMVIENLNLAKYFTIITSEPQKLCEYININLKSSATISQAKGAYSGEDRFIVMTVMRRGKALKLQKFMRQNDPTAFMFITNTSEIIGRGFREFS